MKHTRDRKQPPPSTFKRYRLLEKYVSAMYQKRDMCAQANVPKEKREEIFQMVVFELDHLQAAEVRSHLVGLYPLQVTCNLLLHFALRTEVTSD